MHRCHEAAVGIDAERRLDGRDALKSLIRDVEAGAADFSVILVYDVSRWGRFQDADESAYYEFICKQAGIKVLYCAEQFENDGSLASTILKGLKRAAASSQSTAAAERRTSSLTAGRGDGDRGDRTPARAAGPGGGVAAW